MPIKNFKLKVLTTSWPWQTNKLKGYLKRADSIGNCCRKLLQIIRHSRWSNRVPTTLLLTLLEGTWLQTIALTSLFPSSCQNRRKAKVRLRFRTCRVPCLKTRRSRVQEAWLRRSWKRSKTFRKFKLWWPIINNKFHWKESKNQWLKVSIYQTVLSIKEIWRQHISK